VNAGPDARRSASSEIAGADAGPHPDLADVASAGPPGLPTDAASAGPPGLPADVAPAGRRRRPSSTSVFLGVSGILAAVFDAAGLARRARRGPWRAEVAEDSMAPALLPGDWLLLDPTCRRWPRPGTIVVIREPGTGVLAIKRVAARGARRRGAARREDGGVGAGGRPDASPSSQASRDPSCRGDAVDGSIDSRAYGPLDADALVARAWFRYGPRRRIGRLR
jgi:hypothetical protein